jgi:hypothetical protein
MNPMQTPAQLLVVAAPETERAQELTHALRQSGWQAALATAPEQIVPPLTGTLVVLTSATQQHPTISAALSMPGLRRIPIFAEPMVLPFGEWASAPVLVTAVTDATVRTVVEAVFGPPPALVQAAPVMAPAVPSRRSEMPAILGIGGLLLSIIVVVVGIVVINTRANAHVVGVTATATPLPSYMTDTPGVYCDHGAAVWRKYTNLQMTCQTNGTLLSVKKDDGYLEYSIFEPVFNGIPNDYRLGVQTTFESGDANTAAYLDVHEQISYGSQVFAARADGTWFIYRLDKQGHFDAYLDRGTFAPAAKTLNLQVEVHGANMLYTINGQKVSSVTDNTYLSSVDLAFGLFDFQSTKPYSALFTHFDYTPLS